MDADPQSSSATLLWAPRAWIDGGWQAQVLLRAGSDGRWAEVRAGVAAPPQAEVLPGPVLPGLVNAHSHAFQRAFAGLTEYRGAAQDSFWTWRDLMYRFAGRISPEALEDIATHLYVEMLAAGYTAVCEFHYVHHDPAGQPYADPAEMSLRLVAAARRAGIGLTMLPVLYQHSGFGARPPRDDQRRFIDSVDGLLRVV